MMVRLLVAAGARVAEPGEFTRRAFLNGRMDLSRAEAVAQVIAARSEAALRVAQANLQGATARRLATVRDQITLALAELEAQIDFPEERLECTEPIRLAGTLAAAHEQLAQLARSWGRGRALAQGLSVALVGRPNVGKSSLFNALLGRERALVTAEPGTTRDYLEAHTEWDGAPVTLIDTAGERPDAGELERRGAELGRQRVAAADVVVLVVDATDPILPPLDAQVIALNQIDRVSGVPALASAAPVVRTSATRGTGLDALRSAVLASAAAAEDAGSEVVLASARQHALVMQAAAELAAGEQALAVGTPPELAALELRAALSTIAQVTGQGTEEAVLDTIFARFCIGK
jgi:tRNA modification GTPase